MRSLVTAYNPVEAMEQASQRPPDMMFPELYGILP